jgi:hypothetical protein
MWRPKPEVIAVVAWAVLFFKFFGRKKSSDV